jgi:hypothetical protein
MPIKSIFWNLNTGRDIHVLRGGFSRDLTHESLVFEHTDGSLPFADDYLVTVADVTLTFTPLFKGTPQGDDFVGDNNGITVNQVLGSVTVEADLPINVKNNFIIEVEAKNDGDGKTFHETIRVQVHGSVTQLWLTPDQLTIRPPFVTWVPRTAYSVGESLVDANHNLQAVTGITARITNVAISDNVLTLTVNQNFAVDANVNLDDLTAAAFLNDETIVVKTASATQITADFTHTDFASADNGTAVADGGAGLSGNGPGQPAFSAVEDETVTDNQLIWTSRGHDWRRLNTNTHYRFSLRAQFDDGVVGDLTENHNVIWNDPFGHVRADGTISFLADDNVDDKFFVSATLPIELGGATTPIGPTVQVGRKWADEPSAPKATIVAGGGFPPAGTAENAPNILMLGDGFRIQDEDSFNRIVDTLVTHIKTNLLAKPYNLLSSRINFWKAFLPADQVGISFRREVYIVGIHPFARTIPAVKKPNTEPWGLENVLYKVGLPVPGDDRDVRTPSVLRAEWKKLLQNDPSPNIDDDLVRRWKQLANRTFIEERDGFPGMCYGEPPSANQAAGTPQLSMHSDRALVDGLIPFYKVLASDDITLADGRPVGTLWAENVFRFDNTDLVLIISSFPGGRAVNDTGFIALSTSAGDAYITVQPVAGKNAFTLDFNVVPTDVEADRARTVAHELGHSFGLGDEYADFDTVFPEDHADASQANLQTEKDTQIPDPADASKKIISGDEISWVWHRILAATVVNGDITAESLDTFRIPVEPDVSFRFVQGDELLLRPRIRGKPLRKFASFEISKTLIVQEVSSDSLVVRALGAISAEKFPPGSLLFNPKPAPASVLSAAYPYAEMVAKNIKDAITKNKAPLTVVPCVMDHNPKHPPQKPILGAGGTENREPVANLRQGLADRKRIVGLYAEGALSSCGIFHPTGHCMMRQDHEEAAEFCAVCRYIMVDMIAPEFHPEIDADYDQIYPLV